MKKLFCMTLVLLICFACLTACGGEEYNEEEALRADEIDVEITEFSGYAHAPEKMNEWITVDVCEEYRDILGDTVIVVLPKSVSGLSLESKLVTVTIDCVKNTKPLTVYAKEYEVQQEIFDYPAGVDKPVIYFYPEADTECSVKVTLTNGELTCTYPEHGTNGWQNFVARPDGTLIFPDGSEYYCLYWEAKCDLSPDFEKGFCVKGSDTAKFLETTLLEMGLLAREANEFIIYWLPILQENPYNLISFQKEAYTSVAELEITPTPDSLLRVYMTAKPMDAYVEIEPQTFDGFERSGFTVVEWGGSIIE